MTEPGSIILAESLRLLEYWGSILRAGDPRDGAWLWLRVCYDDPRRGTVAFQIRHFGVPYDPAAWLDRHPTAAERQGFSRAVKRLAELDLLTPVARYGTRTSHVRLTPVGVKAALKLLDANDGAGSQSRAVDLEAIRLAIQHCRWATPDHLQAVATSTAQPEENLC